MNRTILFSCEHGGNQLPAGFIRLFDRNRAILKTHRGLDIGALGIAQILSTRLHAPLFYSKTSRLLVDLNRSSHHRDLFSKFTRDCDLRTKQEILQEHYYPYRQSLEDWIQKANNAGSTVLHLSIHTFTPKLDGIPRNADIGLLYDPSRLREREFCDRLKLLLIQSGSGLIVRRNYPYRGTADGLTTYFRKTFRENQYLGIEIEINQKLAGTKGAKLSGLIDLLCNSIPRAASAT